MRDDSAACRRPCLVNWQRWGAFLQSMILSLRHSNWAKAIPAALFLLTALFAPAARGADKDKGKEKKPEKEKKEKIEPWVEIRTAHFVVASDGGEKTARRFADEFEGLLRVLQATMPNARVSTGVPVRILVSRNADSFARVLPEFPNNKNREQPPGLYFSSPEKTYIAIRANAGGRFALADFFQSYAREVMKHSYRNLPPWVDEGYSTVYSSLTYHDGGFRLERPDPDDLSVLFESPLLPVDLVLGVDRTSGYYSPSNKSSVYFAESRVLLHYLISDSQYADSKAMERYVTAVQGGKDSLQAARDAFGDLNQLHAKLEAYVKNVSGPGYDIPVAGGSDSGGALRMLSLPESDARIADFLAVRGKSEDAEDKLNDALMAEPSLAEAEQSLGFITLKREDLDEAQKHFDKAAQLDPKDAENFYGQGLVAIAKGGKEGAAVRAAEPLEKAVALNPEFAAAWSKLAEVYSQKSETLPKALADAQRAASLLPGEGNYQLQLGSILSLLGQPEEARKMAAQVQLSASDRTTAEKAGELVARTSKPQPSGAPPISVRNPPTMPSSEGPPKIENKTEPQTKPTVAPPVSEPAKAQPAPAPVPPLFSESSQVYSMVGTITQVDCGHAPQVQVTLKSQTIVMKLHADDVAQLSIKAAGAAAASKGAACASLRGRNARISYLFVTGKPWDAEMQSVEFRTEP
jgi:tetratricopeptide (TPR) repeat protein